MIIYAVSLTICYSMACLLENRFFVERITFLIS